MTMVNNSFKCWRRDAVLCLINVYKSQPCLYDINSVDYHNRDKNRKAVKEMTKAVSKYHPDITDEECRTKYHGLRSQFRAEYTKVVKSKFEPGEIYFPKLWCFEELEFLKDFVQVKKRTLEESDSNDSDDDEDAENEKEVLLINKEKNKNQTESTFGAKWNREAVLQLINVYRRRPCLYDPKSTDYHSRQKNREALQEMVAAVSEYHSQVTNEDCKRKYQSLRDQFRKEYSRIVMSDNMYSSKLWCFEELLFLKDYVQIRKGIFVDVSTGTESKDSIEDEEVEEHVNDTLVIYKVKENYEVSSNDGIKWWKHDAILSLIKVYKKQPCLYNYKSVDYYNRKKNVQAFEEMVAAVSKFHPEVTIEDCRRKCQILRTQFRKEYGKIMKNENDPDSYYPTLWCFEELLFLGDYLNIQNEKIVKSTVNVDSNDTVKDEEAVYEDLLMQCEEDDSVEEDAEVQKICANSSNKRSLSCEPTNIESKKSKHAPISSSRLSPSNNSISTNDSSQEVLSLIEALDKYFQRYEQHLVEDECTSFGRFVATRLRNMKNKNTRLELEHDIIKVIMAKEVEKRNDN